MNQPAGAIPTRRRRRGRPAPAARIRRSAVLLDVRETNEFLEVRVPGAAARPDVGLHDAPRRAARPTDRCSSSAISATARRR